MKKIKTSNATFEIDLSFSGEISESHKDAITDRILNILLDATNNYGIVPDDCKEYTKSISVARKDFVKYATKRITL